jgi:hypothetical protein
MKQHNYFRYFRVFHNDTVVTEISTNDFHPLKLMQANQGQVTYSLPINERLFYGYLTQAKAMEMAKAGALKHINSLIDEGKPGEKALYKYRFDHFQDLTVNLVEGNIQEVEDEALAEEVEKDSLNIQPS